MFEEKEIMMEKRAEVTAGCFAIPSALKAASHP
jgi:hypothetical protein